MDPLSKLIKALLWIAGGFAAYSIATAEEKVRTPKGKKKGKKGKSKMPKKPVFFSFHFKNDVMRVQQIRNIGVIEGNSPISPNAWEEVKRKGEASIKNWIDENMKYKSCVVVLVGSETAHRPWVQYEIRRGWDTGKAVVGIHIHGLNCPNNGTCTRGPNPFDLIRLNNGALLSSRVKCHVPNTQDAYGDIARNIESWIDDAVRARG